MFFSRFSMVAATIATLGIMPQTVLAQNGNFELELNATEDVGVGCRVIYVATNNTGVALDRTSYEVVIFDDAGQVSETLVLEFGQLPLNKTRVVQFDLASQACGDISRILVNNAVDCVSASGKLDVCMTSLIASSRSQTIRFGL